MPALTRRRSTERRQQKITLGEMRASGVRGLLIYCSEYRCSHSTAISGDRWPDDVRLSELENAFSRCQRPKNSHSRMITGIGTPTSQSRIPRPMFASLNSSDGFKNAKRYVGFQHPCGKSTSPVTAGQRLAEGLFARPFAGFHQLGVAAVFSGHLKEPLTHL